MKATRNGAKKHRATGKKIMAFQQVCQIWLIDGFKREIRASSTDVYDAVYSKWVWKAFKLHFGAKYWRERRTCFIGSNFQKGMTRWRQKWGASEDITVFDHYHFQSAWNQHFPILHCLTHPLINHGSIWIILSHILQLFFKRVIFFNNPVYWERQFSKRKKCQFERPQELGISTC